MRKIYEEVAQLVNAEAGVSIEVVELTKQDGVHLGLTQKFSDTNIAPVVYLDPKFIEDYKAGRASTREIVLYVMGTFAKALASQDLVEDKITARAKSIDSLKSYLFPVVVNAKHRDDYDKAGIVYREIPCTDLLMLVRADFSDLIPDSDGSIASALINKGMLDELGMTTDELIALALESGPSVMPADKMTDLAESIGLPALPGAAAVYVLTNELKHFGAAVLFYPGKMEEVSRLVGGSYYVIPSSVHEVLIIPATTSMPADDIRMMLLAINPTLEPEDVLSDELYMYDADKGQLVMVTESTQLN